MLNFGQPSKQVTSPRCLGSQIVFIVPVGRKDMRDPIDHTDIGRGKLPDLVRIVGQKADRTDIELPQNLRRRHIDTLIGVESKVFIGIDGINPQILQGIRPEFVNQSNVAAFLRQVDQYAAAGAGDLANRAAQLITAIASQAAKQVASKALRMQADQHRPAGVEIANDDRHMFLATIKRPECNKTSVLRVAQRYRRRGCSHQTVGPQSLERLNLARLHRQQSSLPTHGRLPVDIDGGSAGEKDRTAATGRT